eukprot:4806289-Pleurochrysis_carterae.AAC.1
MSWWKGSTRTGKSALNRTFPSLRPYPIGSNVRRQHLKLLPAVEVAAPVALGRAEDKVVKLVAELYAISWSSRTRDTNDGIERKVRARAADGLILATQETCLLLELQRIGLVSHQ